MALRHLNFPFDEELFLYSWQNTPDVILTNMIESGAVVRDARIEALISNGSNLYTVPFYGNLEGTPQIYNGINDFTYDGLAGDVYSGVVYGRMKAWRIESFIKDFNSGADPMQEVVNGVARYWQKEKQKIMLGILNAIFRISDTNFIDSHTMNLATTGASVADTNRIGATTINDLTVKANGDHALGYSMAIMHSQVANRLAQLQLLEFLKYTDSSGITRSLPIGTINGLTVIVNDSVPVVDSASATGAKEYTTYVLGNGAIRYAPAPVATPVEFDRNPEKAGGVDMIYTRIRETMLPDGFSFKGNYTTDIGIPDTVLFDGNSWKRVMPEKSILVAKLITN